MNVQFALIHSPLVGPATWELLIAEFQRRGLSTIVPRLRDTDGGDVPYWQQEVESATAEIEQSSDGRPLVLVGRSGAGTLLPVIGQHTRRTIAGIIYVDAGLPLEGQSRLVEMSTSSPEFADQLREELARGNRAPTWSDDDLRSAIPDDTLRCRVLSELQPRPLAFFEEPIPSPAGWERTPSGYVLFSRSYVQAAEHARQLGWPCRTLPGGHFHMLVDPIAVAAALISIRDSWKSE